LQNIKKQKGSNDFSHIFWFSIQQILKWSNLDKELIKSFKDTFYDQLKDKKWPIYLRFLSIS